MLVLGWREWVALPELGIDRIKAKIDTGARTSALHTFEITELDGGTRARFYVHPNQQDTETVISCEADIVDRRIVRDSGGHEEERLVIRSPLVLGGMTVDAEITLTARDNMGFRMLVGRTAIAGHCVVDPQRSYCLEES